MPNPTVSGNLILLNLSAKFVKRSKINYVIISINIKNIDASINNIYLKLKFNDIH